MLSQPPSGCYRPTSPLVFAHRSGCEIPPPTGCSTPPRTHTLGVLSHVLGPKTALSSLRAYLRSETESERGVASILLTPLNSPQQSIAYVGDLCPTTYLVAFPPSSNAFFPECGYFIASFVRIVFDIGGAPQLRCFDLIRSTSPPGAYVRPHRPACAFRKTQI